MGCGGSKTEQQEVLPLADGEIYAQHVKVGEFVLIENEFVCEVYESTEIPSKMGNKQSIMGIEVFEGSDKMMLPSGNSAVKKVDVTKTEYVLKDITPDNADEDDGMKISLTAADGTVRTDLTLETQCTQSANMKIAKASMEAGQAEIKVTVVKCMGKEMIVGTL